MTFFKRLFQKQQSVHGKQTQFHPNSGDKLEKTIQQGYEALRDNISTALLSHMRAELRYRILHDQQKAYEDAPLVSELSLWQRFRPAWQTGFAGALLSIGLGLYFYINPEAALNTNQGYVQTESTLQNQTIKQNNKKNDSQIQLTRKEFGVQNGQTRSRKTEESSTANNSQNHLQRHAKNIKKTIEASLQKSLWQQARLRVWQKNQWHTASSFAPIPHQRTQNTRHKEDSGLFLFDYWKVNHRQKNRVHANKSSQVTPTFVTYQD